MESGWEGGQGAQPSWKLPSGGPRAAGRAGGAGLQTLRGAPGTQGPPSIITGQAVQVTLFPVPALPHPPSQQQPPAPPPTAGHTLDSPSQTPLKGQAPQHRSQKEEKAA